MRIYQKPHQIHEGDISSHSRKRYERSWRFELSKAGNPSTTFQSAYVTPERHGAHTADNGKVSKSIIPWVLLLRYRDLPAHHPKAKRTIHSCDLRELPTNDEFILGVPIANKSGPQDMLFNRFESAQPRTGLPRAPPLRPRVPGVLAVDEASVNGSLSTFPYVSPSIGVTVHICP